MTRLLRKVCIEASIKFLCAFELIFAIAAFAQAVFSFILIFTPFLDSYMSLSVSGVFLRGLSVFMSFLFFVISIMTGILHDKIKEQSYYIR